jgi:hypothetical protein
MTRVRLGSSPCGGVFEAPVSLWWGLAAVAAAAVRGGGEAEAPRSRCVEELAAGLRLLGYRVERVSGSRLVVDEEEPRGAGGSLAVRCGLLPAALLVPLAAVRLAPGRRLVLRSEAAGGEAGRALVEAAVLLGARAWRLENGRGVVVEAGGGLRRLPLAACTAAGSPWLQASSMRRPLAVLGWPSQCPLGGLWARGGSRQPQSW